MTLSTSGRIAKLLIKRVLLIYLLFPSAAAGGDKESSSPSGFNIYGSQ